MPPLTCACQTLHAIKVWIYALGFEESYGPLMSLLGHVQEDGRTDGRLKPMTNHFT